MCRTAVERLGLAVVALAAVVGIARGQAGGPLPTGAGQDAGSLRMDDVLRRTLTEGARGSLAVQVVQGTSDGPAVGEAAVSVDLYHKNTPIWQITATLDESGVALLGDLPVALEVRPVVRIEYDGVSYLEVGPQLDEQHPDGAIRLTVYQTTRETPAWRVAMRHIMVSRVTDGTVVNETLVVENPTDKTWFGGEPMRDDKGTSVRVRLPAAVEEVHLDAGFHGWCCTTFEGRELAVQMPLMPGRSTFVYTYFIPTQPERVDLRFEASAPTDSVVVFVPDDGTSAEATAMTLTGTENMGQQRMRSFQATGIEAGQEAGVVLTALKPGKGSAQTTVAGGTPWLMIMIAGGIVVLGIVGVLSVRGRGL